MSIGPISGDFNCNYLVKEVSASFPLRKFNIFPFYLVSSRAIFWYILKYFTHKCHVSYQNYPLVFTSIDISHAESSISKLLNFIFCLFSNFIISSTFISWNSYSWYFKCTYMKYNIRKKCVIKIINWCILFLLYLLWLNTSEFFIIVYI